MRARLATVSALQLAAAIAGVLIALYLTWTRLTGGLPACGPGGGCETVALSEYSELFGVPVAVLGLGYSVALLGAIAAWIRLVDRRALYVAYAVTLFGVLFVAYLTYLELFVIHAICAWCVAYAATIVVAFVVTGLEIRARPE